MTKKNPHLTTTALLDSTNAALRNWPITWIVLVVGLIMTITATLYMKSSVEINANVEFTSNCNEIKNKIINRLDDHARILLSGAALFNATETVTREEWRVFNKTQKVEQQLPGIQGIGFSLLIPPAELSRHIQKIRREGFPQYKLRPDGVREIYSSIIYLEPFSGRNLRAFGYDMLSEPVRRSAMERARDTDNAALSGKVILVQETDKEVQAGTLMYVPVYRKGMPIETVQQRRAAIYGWIYSPYRMNDLMQGIIGNRKLEKEKQLHLQVFDGTQPSPQNLLYECHPEKDQALWPKVRFTRQIPVDFNGQRWTLRFTQTGGGFATVDYISVWLTLASGIIISLLLLFLILALLNAHAKAHIAENLAAELRETKEYLENLIDYANVPIVVWNQQFHITRFNHAFESLTGRLSGDVLGNNLEMLFPPDLVDSSMEHIKRMPLGEHWESLEINILHANGSVRTVLWNSATIFAEDGMTPIATIAQGTDITERKQAEKALKESEEQLRNIFLNAPIGIFHSVWEGTLVTVNPALSKMLGYSSPEELILATTNMITQIYVDPAIRPQIMADLMSTDGWVHYEEVLWRRKDHRIITVDMTGRKVLSANGDFLYLEGFIEDISERKQVEAVNATLEAQNRQLQKTESLSRMAASIAHLFNNQLGVVIGNLELAMMDVPKVGSLHESITSAMKAAWKSAEISGLMLTYLGQSLDNCEPLDLSSSCHKILPILKAALPENVILKTDFSSPGPVSNTNTDYLQQILTNLFNNAWEAIGKDSGTISLSVKKVSSAAIPTAHRFPIDWQTQDSTCACLEVTDTGSGIADKDIEKIFDPFYTSKFTGRGMGLAVVLGIVKTHKGVLTVESKAKQGSTFRIFFPLSE